jgi:predicted HTH domain antitoxin
MTYKLEINYPDTLPDVLQETPEAFEREAKMAMAAKLFELKRISSGMAASLVGMDRVSFLLNLHHYNVNMIDMDEDELVSDVNNA